MGKGAEESVGSCFVREDCLTLFNEFNGICMRRTFVPGCIRSPYCLVFMQEIASKLTHLRVFLIDEMEFR